jgi:hypothetical protein
MWGEVCRQDVREEREREEDNKGQGRRKGELEGRFEVGLVGMLCCYKVVEVC